MRRGKEGTTRRIVPNSNYVLYKFRDLAIIISTWLVFLPKCMEGYLRGLGKIPLINMSFSLNGCFYNKIPLVGDGLSLINM